jgi:hypothetical protein
MGAEIEFTTFDPDIFQLCTALRSKALCLMQHSGITKEELKILCVQCIRCENIVSRVTQHSHRCPAAAPPPSDKASADDIFQSLEYRLDAVGDQESTLNGLTKTEFEELFSVCTVCDRYVMSSGGRNGHLCFA